MIKSNYSIKIIKITFNKIIKQLNKDLYKGSNSRNSLIESIEEERKNSYDLLSPKNFIMKRKKTIIKQPDLYYNIFKNIENKNVSIFFQLLEH